MRWMPFWHPTCDLCNPATSFCCFLLSKTPAMPYRGNGTRIQEGGWTFRAFEDVSFSGFGVLLFEFPPWDWLSGQFHLVLLPWRSREQGKYCRRARFDISRDPRTSFFPHNGVNRLSSRVLAAFRTWCLYIGALSRLEICHHRRKMEGRLKSFS